MASMLPVDEAVRRVVADVRPVSTETVPLAEADGRTLSENLAARRTQPPFPASAMDGYALRAADGVEGARLKVLGSSAAGAGYHGALGAGDAVRIFTGAPVPSGADAILMQEDATAADGFVTVNAAVTAGKHIRAIGLDFHEGDVLLPAGRHLGFRELALAAAMNHASLPVRRRPKVAIIATGDELVAPGGTLGPDQIIASNGYALGAFVRANGGAVLDLGIVPDDRAKTAAAVARARGEGVDVLVTLGGASVGDHDLVKDVLAAEGMTLDFWRIAMRPGKPLIFGRLGDTRVLGLPGNPVSSIVCAILFLKPLLDCLLGRVPVDPSEPAVLAAPIKANDMREDYVRARITGETPEGWAVEALPIQDSSMLKVLGEAECLLVRPANAPAAKAGERCRIIRL